MRKLSITNPDAKGSGLRPKRRSYQLSISVLILVVALFVSGVLVAQALTEEDIVFPVAELGNCQNEFACKAYCDQPENIKACVVFARKYNLMSEEELRKAEKFSEMGVGPGGCSGKEECDVYCNEIIHMDECIAFAIEHDLMPPEELEEAKKVQAAIARGILPPPCGSKDDCDVYCSSPDHMEECMEFAIAAGLMPPDELEEAQKVLKAVKAGIKPPPCTSERECDVYCSEPAHVKECMEFAIAAGLMPPEEAEEMEMVMKAIRKGVMPPPCKSKEECDVWCAESEEHLNQCTEFFVAAGFMTKKDAEMMRKTGGKSPGDCKSKEECDAFCEANQDVCFEFAQEHGLIPEGELQKMEEGKRHMLEAFTNAPPEVMSCLEEKLGTELIAQLEAGTAMPSPRIGDTIRACFEQFMPKGPPPGMEPGGPDMMPGAQAAGTKIVITQKDGSRFELIVINPNGIQDFSFQPTIGSHYGGGLSGCPKEYKTLTVFDPAGFPLKAVITDCEGNVDELEISSEGEYSTAPTSSGGMMPQEGIMDPSQRMMPPEGMMNDQSGGMFMDLGGMPPEVMECVHLAVGEEIFENIKAGQMPPPIGFAVKIKTCFEQQMQIPEFGGEHIAPPEEMAPLLPEEEGERIPLEMQSDLIRQMTPEMIDCLRSVLGDEMVEKMKVGEMPPLPDLEEKMRPCIEMYKVSAPLSPSDPCDFNKDGNVDEFEKKKCEEQHATPPPEIMCPTMISVEMCPPGQEKFIVHESQECGTYYSCKPSEEYVPPKEEYIPPPEIISNPCDFNKDGKVDEFEKEKCEGVPTEGIEPPKDNTELAPTSLAPLKKMTAVFIAPFAYILLGR